MVSLNFGQPIFLWFLVFLPMLLAAHFYFLKRNQVKALRFANFVALKRIAGERFVTKNVTVLILRLVAFFALVVVLSQASFQYTGDRNDFDYVLAIDTSSSMTTRDLDPNRFAAAKSAATTFLNSLDSTSAVGLVDFSGVVYVRSPLSEDHFDVRFEIGSLNISRVGGTDIAGAIITSVNMLSASEQAKAIILFTDGVDTVGAYIENNIIDAANYAKQQNVVIHPVGLGTQNALVGYLPVEYNLTSSVNRPGLEYLANITGGTAIYPESTDELESFFGGFDDNFHTASIEVPLYRYALILAFVLLVIEWILVSSVFRRVA